MVTETRLCTRCQTLKTEADYQPYTWRTGGRYCRVCMNSASKAAKAKNPEKYKTYHRDHGRRTRYGISPEHYAELLEKQGDKCGICGKLHSEEVPLYIDHHHDTGVVRGLLCRECNSGLGFLKDSEQVLLSAINYLNGKSPS